MESFASTECSVRARRYFTAAMPTGEPAVLGMPRPVVDAVIEVVVVVSFMMVAITTVPPIAKVLLITVLPIAMPPIGKVVSIAVPIATVTKVSIKIMVAVAEE